MAISRRSFMKGVLAVCAASTVPGTSSAYFNTNLQVKQATGRFSTCEMCSGRCPVEVQVTDNGKIVITGNKHATSQGSRICARGVSGYSLFEDKDRIVQPLKRKGERGSGEWEIISWETAFDEISAKLDEIRTNYGPHSVAFSAKSGSLQNHMSNFAKAYGSPNIFTHSSMCPGARYIAADIMLGGNMLWDLENCNYLIHFGHNLYEGIEVADTAAMMNAQNRGMKVVSFDPRLSIASAKADEYFYVKPGADLLVLLAMCNHIIQNNLYDKEFIDRYATGFNEFAAAVRHITPEFAEERSDVPAADIVRIAEEFMAAAPAAVVSPGHRNTYSFEEFDTRRAMFALNVLAGNIERKGGLYKTKAASAYNKLAGEEVAPALSGLGVKYPPASMPRIDDPDGRFKHAAKRGGVYQSVITAILDEKPYAIKGWVMTRTNPMQTLADYPAMAEAAEKVELIVSCDLYMTDTSAFADYILPECTYLERFEDISNRAVAHPAYSLRQPVLEVTGNAKSSTEIWYELAVRLGLGEYYPWKGDMMKYIEMQTKSAPELRQELLNKGYVSYGIPLYLREPSSVREFAAKYKGAAQNLDADGTFASQVKFSTASGKIELYSKELEEIWPGYGTVRFQDLPLPKEDGELYFIQGKTGVHTNGATAFVDSLSRLMPQNPVWIHPDTASKANVKTGDKVILKSAVGEETGVAHVTDAIRPDTVFTYMAGSGVKKGQKNTEAAKNGAMCSNLLPLTVNDITGMVLHVCGVTLAKAGR